MFIVLLKDKVTKLCLSSLLCPFNYYMKGKWYIFIWKFISYFKNGMNIIEDYLSKLAYT